MSAVSFIWAPIHCPSTMVSLISSDVKLTFVILSFFSMMVVPLVLSTSRNQKP